MNYYVYLHIRKSNGKPFYVGKGSGYRSTSRAGRNFLWKLTAKKHGFDVILLEENLTEEEAYEREEYWIKRIGRENLCNFTDGGHGVNGFAITQETRRKMSASKMGAKNSYFGKKHSEEIRLLMSERHHNSKLVLDLSTGIYYDSGRKAAEALGRSVTMVKKYLAGTVKNRTNLKYV